MRGTRWNAVALVCALSILAGAPLFARAAEGNPIQLRYGSYAPEGAIDRPILWFIQEAAKKSGVKINVETYFNGTLAKPPDCLGAIGKGAYSVGWISSVFTTAKTPLAVIPNATPVVAESIERALNAADHLVRTLPAAQEEFKRENVEFLFHSGVWKYELISTKPVRSLEDIKGLKVRTFGYLARVWAELGGVPVSVPISEAYDALQKGTIDGVLTQPVSMYKTLRLAEVAKHVTMVDLGCLAVPVVMNMRTWQRLPEAARAAMIELEEGMPAVADKMISGPELEAIEQMRKDGIGVYELPMTDKDRIAEVGMTIAKAVVDDLKEKGVADAEEAMEIYLSSLRTSSQ